MNAPRGPRVLTIAPMPPEKVAYALARYSRSPDSIAESIEWVRTHDSAKFLESFYFQYGHASIADLGHLVVCFEGVSELAATEIEDEQLWDGQARSSRYQDFGKSGFVVPPELTSEEAIVYRTAGDALLTSYRQLHQGMIAQLTEMLPRPNDMKPDAYTRNIAARAYDVARYCLFFGIPTGVGQVVSIRTLERQVRRMKASEYAELRELGDEVAAACAAAPTCGGDGEPLAPTLARHVDPDGYLLQSSRDLKMWAHQNLLFGEPWVCDAVELHRPSDLHSDIVATLLYTVTNRSYKELYELASGWNASRRNEVIDVALQSRSRRDDLLRHFRGGPYVYDMTIDMGAYRDMHRHRRCQQYRQAYGTELGFSTPPALVEGQLSSLYARTLDAAFTAVRTLPAPASHYLLPFAARGRFLFKMDFAEVEYISRLRSGVKGHFSYREVAWKMKTAMDKLEPELGRLIEATPPWVQDPLQR